MLVCSTAVAALLSLSSVALGAQENSRRIWSGSVQANGSIFFGNTEQVVVGSRLTLSRGDSTVEFGFDFQTLYGETSQENGDRTTTKRVWLGSVSLDLQPHATVSPFVYGSVESNLEKRISERYSLGVGAKRTFVNNDRSEASLSLALLDERTEPRRTTAAAPEITRLTRWSWRGRVRHQFDHRLRISHVTFWRPSIGGDRSYLIQSNSELIYQLNESISLSLLFVDNYDSEARSRGARVYNDGQVLFGIATRW